MLAIQHRADNSLSQMEAQLPVCTTCSFSSYLQRLVGQRPPSVWERKATRANPKRVTVTPKGHEATPLQALKNVNDERSAKRKSANSNRRDVQGHVSAPTNEGAHETRRLRVKSIQLLLRLQIENLRENLPVLLLTGKRLGPRQRALMQHMLAAFSSQDLTQPQLFHICETIYQGTTSTAQHSFVKTTREYIRMSWMKKGVSSLRNGTASIDAHVSSSLQHKPVSYRDGAQECASSKG